MIMMRTLTLVIFVTIMIMMVISDMILRQAAYAYRGM